jgi:hypothetical protein
MGVYWCTFVVANLVTIAVNRSSTGKLGKPCDKLMAWCSVAICDITVKILVPICGSFDMPLFLVKIKKSTSIEVLFLMMK